MADEESKQNTDYEGVNVTLVGDNEDEGFIDGLLIPSRRKDEEDYWDEEDDRSDVAKAESEAIPEEGEAKGGSPEVLTPPLPFSGLVKAFEESNSLPQNIDAMKTNIDGFGFMLMPTFPLDNEELQEIVREQIEASGLDVSQAAIDAKIEEIRKEAKSERRRLKQFFQYCADESFIELRTQSRLDLETLGNWGWEVVRDEDGKIVRFNRLPFYTIRLCKRGKAIPVTVKRKIGPFEYREFKEEKRFRAFVQTVDGQKVFFKEFGDPRFMSKRSGRYYATEQELLETTRGNPSDGPATEFLHYKIPALRGAYGLPRWIGNVLSVLGSRLSEEVNYYYFKNKGIPPFIIFVENGRLQSGAVTRLRDFMEQTKGDTSKFWRIAILEGESADEARKRGVQWTGNVRFKIQKLMSEQMKDALFQEYDERNRDKVGESFRMPRLLRGDVRDFNRATAESAKSFGEEQVFQPERDRFDSWINRILGPDLNMKYWEFKSLSAVIRDPYALTEMVTALVKAGIITPGEARTIASDIFNREFVEINEPWTRKPLSVYLAEKNSKPDLDQLLDASFVGKRSSENLSDDFLNQTLSSLKELRRVLLLSTTRRKDSRDS